MVLPASAGGQPRIDELSQWPADRGQHRQPSVLDLGLAHPLHAGLLLLRRHVRDDDLAA